MELTEIANKIEALEARAAGLNEQALASKDKETIDGIKSLIDSEIRPELSELTRERNEALQREEVKSLQTSIGTLEDAIKDLRGGFPIASVDGAKSAENNDDFPYDFSGKTSEHSFFADVRMANKGRQDAIERIAKAHGYTGEAGAKALGAMIKQDGKALVEAQALRVAISSRHRSSVRSLTCVSLTTFCVLFALLST